MSIDYIKVKTWHEGSKMRVQKNDHCARVCGLVRGRGRWGVREGSRACVCGFRIWIGPSQGGSGRIGLVQDGLKAEVRVRTDRGMSDEKLGGVWPAQQVAFVSCSTSPPRRKPG